MTDDWGQRLRDQNVPWNDIRERQVLNHILASGVNGRGRRRFGFRIIAAVAAVALLAISSGMLVGYWLQGSRTPMSIGAPEMPRSPVASKGENPSMKDAGMGHSGLTKVGLGGLGYALLTNGAQFAIPRIEDETTLIEQTDGEITYHIEKQMERSVTVQIFNVRIRVIGTVFSVARSAGTVMISVDEGIVEVFDMGRLHTLNRGDSVTVDLFPPQKRRSEKTDAHLQSPVVSQVDDVDSKSSGDGATRASTPLHQRQAPHEIDAIEKGSGAQAGEPRSLDTANSSPDVYGRLAEVDALRRNGNVQRAIQMLLEILKTYPEHAVVPTVWFTLGKLQQQQGQYATAADAFRECIDASPGGPLVEDALAGRALAEDDGGDHAHAIETAWGYLSKYPDGTHGARMRRIVSKD